MIDKILAFVFGVVFLLTVLYIVIASEPLTEQQFFIVRLAAALAAGGIAAVIPGFINVKISKSKAIAIRAGGAIAVFVVVWMLNPPRLDNGQVVDPNIPIETEGFLGNLRDHLTARVGTDVFELSFASGDKMQLSDFFIETIVSGRTYGEVMRKICSKYSCLNCTPMPDAESASITVSIADGPLVATSDSANLTRKRLTCP